MRQIRYLMIVFMIILSSSVFSQEQRLDIYDLQDKPLPEFKGLLLTGDSISSTHLIGKVTLIQFLYLGCVPCMYEARYYNDLIKEFDNSKFDIIAICPETYTTLKKFNDNDSTSPAHPLHEGYDIDRINYKIIAECEEQTYPFGRPQCSTISEKFYLRGYPFSILVDNSGVIRKIYGGFPTNIDGADKKIEELKVDITTLIE